MNTIPEHPLGKARAITFAEARRPQHDGPTMFEIKNRPLRRMALKAIAD